MIIELDNSLKLLPNDILSITLQYVHTSAINRNHLFIASYFSINNLLEKQLDITASCKSFLINVAQNKTDLDRYFDSKIRIKLTGNRSVLQNSQNEIKIIEIPLGKFINNKDLLIDSLNFLLNKTRLICESDYDYVLLIKFLDIFITQKNIKFKFEPIIGGGDTTCAAFYNCLNENNIPVVFTDTDLILPNNYEVKLKDTTFEKVKTVANNLSKTHKNKNNIFYILTTKVRSFENLINYSFWGKLYDNKDYTNMKKVDESEHKELLDYVCFKGGVTKNLKGPKFKEVWSNIIKNTLNIDEDIDNIKANNKFNDDALLNGIATNINKNLLARALNEFTSEDLKDIFNSNSIINEICNNISIWGYIYEYDKIR